MEIVLNQQIKDLGVTEADVQHMLKACKKEVLTNTYEPSVKEVNELVNKAIEEEKKKQRIVLKWIALTNEFANLIKE